MNRLYIITFIFVLLVSCSNKKINWESDFEKAYGLANDSIKEIIKDGIKKLADLNMEAAKNFCKKNSIY